MATILLADDDAGLLPVLALHLRNDDHDVVCAATVEEAIRAAITARPDVMILDLGLMDADGVSVQRRVGQEPGLTPIPAIYLVDEDAPRSARDPRPASASTITRPVPIRELLEKVRRVASDSAGRVRPPRAGAARDASRRSAAA